MTTLLPHADGRWSAADHPPPETSAVWCRGNVGEVFPHVMTPMSSSLYMAAMARGQAAATLRFGGVTRAQMRGFKPDAACMTGVFGGYLYANASIARAVASRTPGLSVEMIDEQMLGLSDAPPHRRGKGEIELFAIGRTIAMMAGIFRRPDGEALRVDQRAIAAYAASIPAPSRATDDELWQTAESLRPWAERMMEHLLLRSARAGLSRSLLERIVAGLGGADLVNRLSAGLGTIESAEPAQELWSLGRVVASDPKLHAVFEEAPADEPAAIERLLRRDPEASRFVDELDAFRVRHSARGPDEWELASPTWSSDPALSIAIIDRLRRAPADRDPLATAQRLAGERAELEGETRRALPAAKRRPFDIAMRATAFHSAQREATKAAFMRAMSPAREALTELARRSQREHRDFFLLRFEEARRTRDLHVDEIIAERRERRDFLQARIPPFWFEGHLPAPATWPLRADRRRADARPRRLKGIAVCSGTATGPARVVTDPADPRGIEPGDILVAPLTDPAWTPLFLSAAGVVVDVGAQQSHAAIVARELGIPAVVSVAGASTTIADGTIITVDGSTGDVTVH